MEFSESKREYRRLTSQWTANGGTLIDDKTEELTIDELLAAFWRLAKGHYVTTKGTSHPPGPPVPESSIFQFQPPWFSFRGPL